MSVIVLVTLITVVIVFLSLCCSWWRSQLWLLSTCSPINYVCYAQYCSDVSQHDVQYALLFGNFLPITININISKTTSQFIGWNWACPFDRNPWDLWKIWWLKSCWKWWDIGKLLRKLWKMMAPGYPSLKRAAKISKLCRVQRWWLHLCCILSWMIIPVALPMWLVENMLKPQTRSKVRNTRCCGTRQSCAIRILKERVHNLLIVIEKGGLEPTSGYFLITSPKPISWGEKTTTMRFLVDLPYLLVIFSCHDWQMMSLGIRDPIQCHPQDQ